MKKEGIFIGLLMCLALQWVDAQYISRVLEYVPAPGQYINSDSWGRPSSAESLIGGIEGHLSLGAFGGSVVFSFDQAVENHPDNPYGIDFTIFGNPLSYWSEPGAVWVMKDENNNELPDDTWYLLAGSDYYFSTSMQREQVTYSNPGGSEAADVPWSSASGENGYIRANSVHLQSYYPSSDFFPAIPSGDYTLSGLRIEGLVDVNHPPEIRSLERAFGYADNRIRASGAVDLPDNPYTSAIEGSGGDAFDIDWAVNEAGEQVVLEHVDFIRVQTAVLHEGSYLGEISTEITGAVDVSPAPGVSGENRMLVIRDLPAECDTGSLALEILLFEDGLPVSDPEVNWTTNQSWAGVNGENQLHVSAAGELTLTATLADDPEIRATSSSLVTPGFTSSTEIKKEEPFRLYPNPATTCFYLDGHRDGSAERSLRICSLSGRMLIDYGRVKPGQACDLSGLEPGLYLIRVQTAGNHSWLKLLKH